MASSSGSNWRNPSAAAQQKYGLLPVSDDFEPTPEEQQLLDMYERVRQLERQAARLKEEAARAKLAAAQEEFDLKMAPKSSSKKTKRSPKRTAARDTGSGASEEEASEHDEYEEEHEEDTRTLHERREKALAALREEVEEAKVPKESEQDALRAKMLAEAPTHTVDTEPLLKRKKMEPTAEPKSLIANLSASTTPPHEFSETLELKRGHVLFPTSTDQIKWEPPSGVYSPNDGAFLVKLPDFDMNSAQNGQGNNTLAIKFMAPADAKRFSLNIATPNHDDFQSVLFHFNPRHHERGGQLVVNDKQDGIWGQSLAIPLSQVPLLFGQQACTLLIQITGDGFDVFLENQHCARWEHRREISTDVNELILQFPSTDDYGSPENWTVYRIWWGNRPLMAKGDVSGIAGVNQFNSLHPRKLFISSLSKIFAESEVDARRAELERAFRKYGGDRGVQVIVPTNTTYAFVETESERQADLALKEMAERYRMNRARRSRHEALQEERAAAEAAKRGEVKESSDWD